MTKDCSHPSKSDVQELMTEICIPVCAHRLFTVPRFHACATCVAWRWHFRVISLCDGGAWSVHDRVAIVWIGHEGAARVVYMKPRVCNQ
jgi:hypothetical protein